MAEEFLLDWKIDQPAVQVGKREEVYALVTVRPNISKLGALLESAENVTLPAHLIVVVDVSGSMNLLIRDDPKARIVGHTTSEGNDARLVESDVPSRLQVAIGTIERLTERMGPLDRMTIVAFDHNAYPIIDNSPSGTSLRNAVGQLSEIGGGGTSMGRGLQTVISTISNGSDVAGTRKLVVLTDGEDQEPDFALEQARELGEKCHVPIHAFGTGESVGPFLANICKTTLGGQFRNITNEEDAECSFDEVLTGQKNILATNVKLVMWLAPEIHVQELYRTKPEILYVGKMKPDANNQLPVTIEYMEKGKAYEFLFRCELPNREPGRFRLSKASLTYDVPALNVSNSTIEANIIVEYTTDAERSQMRVGEVRRTIAQAETQRQVLFLQEKIDAIKSGQNTEKDKLIVSRLLDTLIGKFEEFGDQANRNMYQTVRDEFRRNGTISQQTLNQSLAASSKVEESVTEIDVDF